MTVEIGDTAPDFTLRDQSGADVTLSSWRGRKTVVLVFYPLTFTSTCQGELSAIRDELPRFQNDDVQVLAVSVDSAASHRVWAREEGFDFPLLADFWPHGEVARRYGVFNEVTGYAVRGTFVIDKDGVVRWKVVNDVPNARNLDDYKQALAALG